MPDIGFNGFTQPKKDSGINTGDATAAATDLLAGKTAYAKGIKITGLGDADLIPGNIKNGVNIFGVTGMMQLVNAGDFIVNSNDPAKSGIETAFTKVKETRADIAGTYRVKFDLFTSNANFPAQAKVYVNGIAAGILRSTISTTAVTYTEDITVQANDLLQIFAYTLGASASYTVQNFRLGTLATSFTNTLT